MMDFFIIDISGRKVLLLLHGLFFFGGVILFRSLLLYSKTGINPLSSFFKPKKMTLGEELFRLCSLLIGVITFFYCFFPITHKVLFPFRILNNDLIITIGAMVSLIGYTCVLIAQLQMGKSWRIAIDDDKEIEFVQNGLFRFSRNPIYVGLMICLVGYFLILPSLITLGLFCLMAFGIYHKVLDEEAHLQKIYPIKFLAFKNQVRRWI